MTVAGKRKAWKFYIHGAREDFKSWSNDALKVDRVGLLKFLLHRVKILLTDNYLLMIRGYEYEWNFKVKGNRRQLLEWREDGLRVGESCYTISLEIVNFGLIWPYVKLVDFLREIKKTAFMK